MKVCDLKNWLNVATLIIAVNLCNAQSVDSIVHNGEQYYVYPFRKEVKIHREYWKVVEDKAFFADYNNYFNLFDGDLVFSREKFQSAKTKKRQDFLADILKERWKFIRRGRKFGMSATKAIRKNPGNLIEVFYAEDQDVLPPFGAIPDGKYVQLFDEFCLVDENGMCQPDAKRVAGYFTVKNNVLDGEAIWLNFNGDTLKKGTFVNGLKEGEWKIAYSSELNRSISRFERKELRKSGFIEQYRSMSNATFKNGLYHGPYQYESSGGWQRINGEFELGQPSGVWEYCTNDQLTAHVEMANRTDSTISKKPIIRGTSLVSPREMYYMEDGNIIRHDLLCIEASMPDFPKNFYTIPFAKWQDELELEGEQDKSFDLTDAERYNYYEDDYRSYGGSYFNAIELDPTTGRTFPRWAIIDSLGAKMKFDGVYESFYTNGQRFFKYEFKNGELVNEDTLFWDNGQAHDVIIFVADSNKYYRSLFDRDGIRYDQLIYDSLGKFLNYLEEESDETYEVTIDGVVATENYGQYRRDFEIERVSYYYLDRDTLQSDSLSGKVLLTRTWDNNMNMQMNVEYDPATHEFSFQKFNCFGDVHASKHRTFTEDFSGWTGTTTANYGDIVIKGTWSGVQIDLDEIDTLQHQNVNYAFSAYDVSSDFTVLKNEQPYTGEFELNYKSGFPQVKSSSKKLRVDVSSGRFAGYRRYYRAMKKGKKAKRFMLASLTSGVYLNSSNEQVEFDFADLFGKLMYDENGYSQYSAFQTTNGVKNVEGQFLDGKAHGIWTVYDRKGKLVSTVNFNKGEPDGELRLYNYQKKEPKRYHYLEAYDNLDTFPKRKTLYLSTVVNYKNGLREGTSIQYDWIGRIKRSVEYENDYQNGKMVIRDAESHTEATFKDGRLNGYLRTHLTFPKRDSILLYDINLQHGLLNGESKSYHTNGRLAKRGFFLDGEPIEDYESYDTLGFRYHYVKFQYSMPIEEKIWEENALSIRYQFKWEDSIEFNPSDITSTQSLEALLAREGYRQYSARDRYYGRTSLISKEDIECRMTKYYPNDTVARDGFLKDKQKIGNWKFYGYNGNFLYEANYFDSIITINDSVKFRSKGILTDYDDVGNRLYSAYIIEKFEKYDCAHTDHYEVRQLITIDEENDSTGRMNGYVYNFYDNGTIQSEGNMKNGIPDGLWKFYDPFGKLNKMGNYTLGKRHGRWLEGDLAQKKYLGEICMNPNLPDLEKEQRYQENLLDITIINYMMGKLMSTQFYDLNMNRVLEMEESKGEVDEINNED